MEVTGKIKHLHETQTVGANNFRKRELILETIEQYPQFLKIEFVQDKCDTLNNYKVGQEVKIAINLRGREWVSPENETVYFNSIQGWRIDSLPNAVASNSPSNTQPQVSTVAPDFNSQASEPDDLPF